MDNSNYSRRKFIKGTLGTGFLVAGSGLLPSCNIFRMSTSKQSYDAKGLPTVMFGKTGVRIPRIICGLGSRFCHLESDEEAFKMLNFTLVISHNFRILSKSTMFGFFYNIDYI